jgi:hypothetical protein
MAEIKTYSVGNSELDIDKAFRNLCKAKNISISGTIVELLAKYVQADKEGKVLTYIDPYNQKIITINDTRTDSTITGDTHGI